MVAAVQNWQVASERQLRTRIQSFDYIFGRHLEARPHRSDLRRSGGKSQRPPTILTSFCPSCFCLRCVRCQESSSSSYRTPLPHTEPATLLHFWGRETPAFILSSSVDTEQPRSQPSGLQDLECHPAAWLLSVSFQSVDELKQRLFHVWHSIEQCIIDSAIDEWRVGHQACVRSSTF